MIHFDGLAWIYLLKYTVYPIPSVPYPLTLNFESQSSHTGHMALYQLSTLLFSL